MLNRRHQPVNLLLTLAGVLCLACLADSVDIPPPLAMGSLFGTVYLVLLARRAFRLASLPMKRRQARHADVKQEAGAVA